MQYRSALTKLDSPQDIEKLNSIISELANILDVLVSTTAPNGNISGREGQLCLYNNSGTYSFWVCTGSTVWQQLDAATTLLWEIDGTETQLKTADEIDMQTKKIINLVDPTADQEAATKKYVDDNAGRSQLFAASGTFTVPTGITKVYLTMVGAGGGGGGGGNLDAESGGGGGAGVPLINMPLTVTPAAGLTVTINAGGAGGIGESADGSNGGTTVFDSITCVGGNKGIGGGAGAFGAGGAAVGSPDASEGNGGTMSIGKSGAGATGVDTTGGGGGASPFGNGGAGNYRANGNASSGYGSGGAGGGGNQGGAATNGGVGTAGFVLVRW